MYAELKKHIEQLRHMTTADAAAQISRTAATGESFQSQGLLISARCLAPPRRWPNGDGTDDSEVPQKFRELARLGQLPSAPITQGDDPLHLAPIFGEEHPSTPFQ